MIPNSYLIDFYDCIYLVVQMVFACVNRIEMYNCITALFIFMRNRIFARGARDTARAPRMSSEIPGVGPNQTS